MAADTRVEREQALRLGEQAVAGGQLACIRRIQQGVVGRRVPQEEGQTGGERVVIEDHAGGILRVGGAQLHPVDEVWRLQQAGETVLESAEEVSKHGLRVPGDGPVAPELFVRQRSPPDATPGALQKLARTHIVCRRGRRAASERRASARVREHLLRDGERRRLELLRDVWRQARDRGADGGEAGQPGVLLEVRGNGHRLAEEIVNAVRVLRDREPPQRGGRRDEDDVRDGRQPARRCCPGRRCPCQPPSR